MDNWDRATLATGCLIGFFGALMGVVAGLLLVVAFA